MGVGEGIAGMNSKKANLVDKIPSWLKIDVNPDRSPKQKKNQGGFLTWDLGQKLDKTEEGLIRIAASLFILVMVYSGFSVMLSNQISKKAKDAEESISATNAQIELANSDSEKIKSKTNEYTTMIKNLEDMNDKLTDRSRTKNAIPNLLNQIMFVIPENVQITSIANTTGTHIEIEAKSDKYEQLGYLKAKIKSDVILNNVISSAGQKDNNVVTVKIEGDLP
jgi:ABC-type multidrug transport system fused ATPase/permease subunit